MPARATSGSARRARAAAALERPAERDPVQPELHGDGDREEAAARPSVTRTRSASLATPRARRGRPEVQRARRRRGRAEERRRREAEHAIEHRPREAGGGDVRDGAAPAERLAEEGRAP